MNWTRCCHLGAWLLVAGVGVTQPSHAHEVPGSALQLFAYQTESAPAPIDGNIAPDGQEGKWRSAYVRSIRFSSADGTIVKDGTLLITSDADYLYLGVGFNSQSAGNVNYARVYFDQNHDHVLDGSASVPGEYFVQVQGSSPSTVTHGGWFGTSGWQNYAVSPAGFEASAEKHGTGNPNTWNFEIKLPLQAGTGGGGESFLNVAPEAEVGLLVEVNDASNGVLYWQPTGRNPQDPSTWGEIQLGVPNPSRDVAGSISLGHEPIIDGSVTNDLAWRHYTSSVRQVQFTNYNGDFISGRLYAKSNASDVYVALVLDGRPAVAGDRLRVFFDYETASGGDLDYILTNTSENGASLIYTGAGTGTLNDTHFEDTPAWAADAVDGSGAVGHSGADYEFEFRVPLAGVGAADLQVALGARLGMNLEFTDVGTGESYWWVSAANSPYQKMRVDAISFTALGWLRLQTGAPVIQPVYPRDNDEVSGHFPFMIYSTSATGDAGIVATEFSDDLGATWQTLERTDESGVWTRVWNTTVLTDGPREIRIRATDTSDLVATAVLQVTVDNRGGVSLEVPTLVVNAPVAGAYVSGVIPVTFTATPAPGRTLLDTEINIDGGAWIAASSPFAWDTRLGSDGSHIFRLRALQSDSLYGYSQPRLVVADNTAPELEALAVAYPATQSAAKTGDLIRVTALVRDARAGLDAATVLLNSNAVDGATHVMVDDGSQGDDIAGDHVYSYAVTVTSTVSGPVAVSLGAGDVLGNSAAPIVVDVLLDNDMPVHVSTVAGDADRIYKNTDTVKLTTAWDGAGYWVTADFGNLDSGYVKGAEQVVDNEDGSYTVTYAISFENTVADGSSIAIPITAHDRTGNGPVTDAAFVVELDNTVPAFETVDTAQDNYTDGETVILIVVMDDSTYRVWSDFSAIDSNYSAGDETVTRAGNAYTVSYTLFPDAQNTTPDGSYALPVSAEDIAGNRASLSTSIELDNTREAVTILRPRDGDLITGNVVIDVTSADDTRFVRFQVSPDGGVNWYNLEGTQQPFDYTQDSDATDGWRQIWRTAEDALPDGVDYHIRVLAYDEQDPVPHFIGQDEVGGGLVVDNTPPTLSIEVVPRPSLGPLRGEVYTAEILLRGSYFDLPDSNRVVGITIFHRNADGDDVNDSPIAVPASGYEFSRRMRMLAGINYITVTVFDEAGLSTSQTAELTYMPPENVVTVGPAGGEVRSPDGTTLTIPAGALLRDEDISVTRVPPDELLPAADPRVTLLKVAHAFDPDGLVFHRAAGLVLTYTDADLDPDQNGTPDWSEAELEVFFWDGFRWVRTEPPQRDAAANTLTLKVNHLATFDIGVMTAGGPSANVYWTRNPLTPEEGSTCVYELPAEGQLSLKIYDMTGHLVRTVVEREPVAIAGSVRWDGLNDFDRYVGSGVYVFIFDFTGNDGSKVSLRKPLGVVK